MSLSAKYAQYKESLKTVSKDIALRILDVLGSPGANILRSEHLRHGGIKVSLKDILVLSSQIKKSINVFKENIQMIGANPHPGTGSQIYITDFGGSKTQYIELICSIIKDFQEKDDQLYNKVVVVKFSGTTDLNASFLGEQIERDTARQLTRQIEILSRDPMNPMDPHAFEIFMNLLLEFRKVKDAPEHLENIHNLLSELDRLAGAVKGNTMRIESIRKELSTLPLIDEERLLKIVLDIMEHASKYGIIYVFFFDECDEWLASLEEEFIWNENILKHQYFFRKLFDEIPHLRLYQIYCFTPRIHEAIRSDKSDLTAGIQRISSDLMKSSSYNSFVEIREQGVYQDEEAIEAVLKWLVLLEKTFQPPDKEIFQSFLPKLIEKISNNVNRRKANSIIISSVRSYMELIHDIKNGQNLYDLAERNSTQYLTIGKIIEKIFASYLNYLNFYFEKKHKDVGEGNLIDGTFIKTIGSEIEIYGEIKCVKDSSSFVSTKVEQVVNCVQNNHTKAIFFVFCSDLDEKKVMEKMHEWKNMAIINPEVNLDLIIPIVINDQTLLNCLVGFENINPSFLQEKLATFDKLLRLMNKDFHGKLINLFPAPDTSLGEEKDLREEAIPKIDLREESYASILKRVKTIDDTIKRTAAEVIKNIGSKNKVYIYRNTDTVKNQIKTPLLKNSFEDAVEYLKQHDILQESNQKLNFNWEIFDKNDVKNNPEGLMIEIFKMFLATI